MTDTARESKRAKDHFGNARKHGYLSVPHRYINGVRYREAIIENGFNLADTRR